LGQCGSALSAAARRPQFDSSERFRDFVEYIIEAEALGFHSTFVVEHHCTGYAQVSVTLNLLTLACLIHERRRKRRESSMDTGRSGVRAPWQKLPRSKF
jgi:hypothetical protein